MNEGASVSATRRERPFVIVQPHLKFGGAENQTVLLANRLVRDGHPVTVILHSMTGGLLGLLDERVNVIGLGFSSHAAIVLGARRALKVLRQMPDSLIIVRLWSSIMLVGLIQSRLQRHRIVYFEDLDPRDHREFIAFGRAKQAIVRRIFRRSASNLVTNTHHVASAMRQIYGLPLSPKVIPCAVDPALLTQLAGRSADLPARRGEILRVVTVGSLIERKGVLELARALGSFDRPVQWLLVGDGPLADEILQTASAFPNLDVVLIGSTSNPYPYMAASDLLVHSARSESFGIVIVEALALTLPVAAHSSNGPREIAESLGGAPIRLYDLDRPETLHEILRSVRLEDSRSPVDIGGYGLDHMTSSWLEESREGLR